jgi:hypothetical protein
MPFLWSKLPYINAQIGGYHRPMRTHRTRMSVADDADLAQVMTKRLSVLRRMPHGTKSHELPMPTHHRWPARDDVNPAPGR